MIKCRCSRLQWNTTVPTVNAMQIQPLSSKTTWQTKGVPVLVESVYTTDISLTVSTGPFQLNLDLRELNVDQGGASE